MTCGGYDGGTTVKLLRKLLGKQNFSRESDAGRGEGRICGGGLLPPHKTTPDDRTGTEDDDDE